MTNLSESEWKTLQKTIGIRIEEDSKKQIYAKPPTIKNPTKYNQMTDEEKNRLLKRILENSHNFGSDDNPIKLSEKMREYLLGIYKWYYKERAFIYTSSRLLDIEKMEKIMIKGQYKKSDKHFLNNIKHVVQKIKQEIEEEIDEMPF